MSAFRRSLNGLGNQHLFHNVDFVVFVEGGKISYPKDEVYAGNYNERSNDIIYWTNVFYQFKRNTKFKFKAIGSKSTIKEIALDIINGNIPTVFVAMDTEFDDILGRSLDHKNVFYTCGYSWENDVWNENVLRAVINELTAIDTDIDSIQKHFNTFLKRIKIGVYSDAYLFSKSDSFFSRPKGHLSCVNCNAPDLPEIKSDIIAKQFVAKALNRSTIYRYAKKNRIDARLKCYGHLLADYCFHTIVHFMKNRLEMPTVSKEIVFRVGINKFFNFFFINSDCYKFHEKQFLRVAS